LGVVISERHQMQAFEALESNVPSYSRSFPAIFSRARGSIMLTEFGRKLVDFSSGAGTLNYGHNNHQIKGAIAEYIASDSVVHGPDMATPAKLEFMKTFSSVILQNRHLHYRLQFTESAGANAIESALMLSRNIAGVGISFHSRMDIMARARERSLRAVINVIAQPAAILCPARLSCPTMAVLDQLLIRLNTCERH